MRGFALFLILAGCSSSSSSKNDIAPDGTLADGGQVVQTPAPTNTSSQDPSKAGTGYTSGSRLKVKVLSGSDGTKIPAFNPYLFDSARNEDCYFQSAADGKTRCLPTATGSNGFYAESNCSTPVAAVPVGACATPTYASLSVTLSGSGACAASGIKIFKIAAPTNGAAPDRA